jgi:epsin
MDLNSLKDAVSNITLYDIKAGVRKVQNGKSEADGRW